MNSPHSFGHSEQPAERRTRANEAGLSLRAYVEREAAAMSAAGGRTMAAILDDLDRYRRPDGPTTADIVDALHEARQERDEQLWPWQQ